MLPCQWIPCLRDLVARPPDLDHIPPDLHTHVHPQHIRILRSPFLLFPRCSPCKVGLVLATLGMRKIGSIILVHCEAETAFEGTNMVFEEVRVFVKVDRFEG